MSKQYICPVCNRGFPDKDGIEKHFMSCWQRANPCHVSKPAPQGKPVTTREVNSDVLNFFNSFGGSETK